MDLTLFEKHFIQLKSPLLLIKGTKGLLACGYLNVETFNKTGEVAAIVTGVRTHEDMLKSKVILASKSAQEAGVTIGMTGEEFLQKIA